MAFRPGLQEPQLGPYVTHPSLHIRDVADAHKVLEAVRLNLLPLIRRRLLAHERAQLRSGNVFVWEECEDVDDGGLVRWTEGRRWSQSRMRGDYLFYEEKVQTTYQEKQAKAARRATRASDPGAVLPPPPKRKDRPAKEDGLTKQTYSVSVRLPGPGGMVATRKWHIVAYFSAADFALLPVVEHYEYLRNIRVPDGIFISSRVPCGRQRFPSNTSHSDDAESASQSGASRSPTTPSFELSSPDVDFFAVPLNHHQNPRPYLLPPPQASGGADQDEPDSVLQNLAWSNNTVAYRQNPIAPSRYQTEMDLEESSSGNTAASHPQIGDVRFWSDFNRMYYLPRTVQKVPDVAEWEIEHGAANWALGHETFLRYDEGTGLMEGPARGFLEECDSIQDRLAWRKTLNDALVLRGLSELAALNIPVQPPSHWQGLVFQNEFIYADPTHPYHSSAILSAHIESVTLPFRLNRSQETILDVAGQLCDSATPFVELSGAFSLPLRSPANPVEARLDLDGRIWNFSALRGTGTEAEPQRPSPTIPNNFWRRNVTRGILSSQKPPFKLYSGGSERLPDAEAATLVNCTHGLAYPLPTSFPAFFRDDQERTPPSAALFSSLGITGATSRLLQSYLDPLDRKSKGFNSLSLQAASDIGVEADDVAQLVADLWDLRERYPSDQQEDNVESDTEVVAEEWE
ncbi:hypothetical protein HMN09_00473300 [Mycena chlorophos]|uniref:DML1/Misato tubulin domain-containing protein n=1 Tax=Mycena chlorophos TaxID=658473 RepID=A0A8H6TH13_MYCCL|nr:hypothetical protein HMN09_00473300 [Mycena chlorophos]